MPQNIAIIGAKKTGKTTYLAALAASPSWPIGSRKFKLFPVNQELIWKVENVLKKGKSLPPTDELSSYIFVSQLRQKKVNIVFHDLGGKNWDTLWQKHPIPPRNFEILLTSEKWLIFVNDWQQNKDDIYLQVLVRVLLELTEEALQKLRIAMILSQCDRGELWPMRGSVESDFFQVFFPKTTRLLTATLPRPNLKFFALSAFGILNDSRYNFDPRPNCYWWDENQSEGGLRQPDSWKPFGLLEPIYP